jgi:hypothetical protein
LKDCEKVVFSEEDLMKWSEVRQLHLDKYIKFEVKDFHTIDHKRYVYDVSILKIINDDKEAMKEFAECKEGHYVCNTKHDEIILNVVKHIGIRMSM